MKPTNEWREEFDREFPPCNGGDAVYAKVNDDGLSTGQYIKSFIEREKTKSWNDGFEKGRSEYLDNDKRVRAEMLVDLYEARAQVIPRVTAHRQMHSVEEVFQYQWLNVIIAKITDKYKIKNEDIKEAIKNRNVEKDNF